MAPNPETNVVALIKDYEQAQRAVEQLVRAGFDSRTIGLIARDSSVRHNPESGPAADDIGSTEGRAMTGALAGAGVGGAWAIGIAAGFLPAIGPVIAGGILSSVIASAAGSAAVGGIVGALTGMGIREEEAHFYQDEFHGGHALITVQAGSRAEEAREILRLYGGHSIDPSALRRRSAGRL